MQFYIKKRWLLLSLVILIVIGISFIYNQFFQSDEADEVCCVKHELIPPKVLTITESTAIANLDSSKANQQIIYNILNQVQEGLMSLGSKNVPIPGLAESYQVSPDYRTYSFTIRKNAVWSDGKAVTANDFKYAWERALSPGNNYSYAFLLYPIQHAEAFSQGKASDFGVTVSDDNHLTVQLDKPDPNFLNLLTLTPFLPLRSDLVEKYGNEFASAPEKMSFTGPFILETVTPQKAILKKNPSYWDQKNVKLPEAVITIDVDAEKPVKQYKSELTGMVKVDGDKFNKMDRIPPYKIVSKATIDFMEMNERNKYLSNKNIRKAIQSTINKTELENAIKDGSSETDSVLSMFQIKKKTPADVTKSKMYLDRGCRDLNIPCNIQFDLITYNIPHFVSVANNIQKQLRGIGIDVAVKKYEIDQKSKMDSEGKFDLSISEWSSYYLQPFDNLKLWFSEDSRNISMFNNKNYDELINTAEMETNLEKRQQIIQNAEQLLAQDEIGVIPLLNRNDLRLQKSYVKNVLYHPFGADYSLKWATYQPPKSVKATK